MKTRSSPLPYHHASEVFYWPVGAAAEWHLSSEHALALRQGEFIWFDTWCAAHIFTGACVVEPRAWFLLSLADTRPWLSRTSSDGGGEERCLSAPLGSIPLQNVLSQNLTSTPPLIDYLGLSLLSMICVHENHDLGLNDSTSTVLFWCHSTLILSDTAVQFDSGF